MQCYDFVDKKKPEPKLFEIGDKVLKYKNNLYTKIDLDEEEGGDCSFQILENTLEFNGVEFLGKWSLVPIKQPITYTSKGCIELVSPIQKDQEFIKILNAEFNKACKKE